MDESKELKNIKKKYGEKFMRMCRNLFSTILEEEGKLYEILLSNFAGNSRTLFDDIIDSGLEGDFKNYVYSKIDVEKEEISEDKSPYELLEEAGYELYECTTEEEIQKFKKYYEKNEALCTFNGGRLNRCVVFFAVKKDADDIRRADFDNPKREDEYGTSVMGIQFNKSGMCTVSIKNRYNHTVNNPDATYGNDLDRIIPGLTESFGNLLKERGLNLNASNIEQFHIPGYTVASDGKYYKYNMEIDGRYFCPGNIIIDGGEIIKLDSEKQILIDNFIVDLEKKTVQEYKVEESRYPDSFVDAFDNIEKIEVRKNNENEKGTRVITIKKEKSEKPILIEIDKDNQITAYKNEELTTVGHNFLRSNRQLSQLDLPNLTTVGNDFLCYNYNENLSELELPSLTTVGNNFLFNNQNISELELPSLTTVGNNFLRNNRNLNELKLPNLTTVGDYFLNNNPKFSSGKINIGAQDIAELDKENEITTSEISWGKSIFRQKEENQK